MISTKTKPNTKEQLDKILNPLVKEWFYNKYPSYSLPQKLGVMEIHSRKNILVSAPTGATKTLTAFMAILNELIDSSTKGILEDRVYAVYVSPLKALNNDIKRNLLEPLQEMEDLHGALGIRIGVRTGDTTTKEKAQMLKHPPHILITTPESLNIALTSPRFREHLKKVQFFIADEIHALAENKRGVDLSLAMERLDYLSDHMTRVGLSATVAPIEEVAQFLVGTRDCTIISVPYIKEMDLQVMSPIKDFINTTHEETHRELYKLLHKLIQEHKTTLIFTNTRAATERIVDYLRNRFPKHYQAIQSDEELKKDAIDIEKKEEEIEDETNEPKTIGAHHGSLSTEHRTKLEKDLKEGKCKVVVCSTSLELGIDIGHIDLVVCLGSPKSVARTLQRIGRSGHQLHSVTKGRIVVLDRDDLVECSLILKSALEKRIDRIHIPTNCLDVLAQHIYGMSIEQTWEEKELFETIRKSYCYKGLSITDFNEVLNYLSGEYASLEDRYIYAKIWRKEGKIGKRGRLARMLYMTNLGTIPDSSAVKVKIGPTVIGSIDESFLERLRPNDVFVLGGSTYTFKHAKGMVAQVSASVARPPTVPSWYSESLPLSFDLGSAINHFRYLMEEKLKTESKQKILAFLHEYLYIDDHAANAIYTYFLEQYSYLEVPSEKKIILEKFTDEHDNTKVVFHAVFGRRVNDVLSRTLAYIIAKTQHRDIELGFNDNGFYVGIPKGVKLMSALKHLNANDLQTLMENAIENSEVLKRRFRHCAGRSLMILRNYKGRTKRAGRQQVSSQILINAVKRISKDFTILREARREVLEDQMDIHNAIAVVKKIESKKIKLVEHTTVVPSPFAIKVVLEGTLDIIKIEDRIAFVKRMHEHMLAKMMLEKNRKKKPKAAVQKEFSYVEHWSEEEKKKEEENEERIELLKAQFLKVHHRLNLDTLLIHEINRLIEGEREGFKKEVKEWVGEVTKPPIPDIWPKELIEFLRESVLFMKS